MIVRRACESLAGANNAVLLRQDLRAERVERIV